jgi:hypothetical protein
MKKKIRSISISGMERSGKTSIARELRMFFKSKNKDLHEINETNIESLVKQEILLKDNPDLLVLKENPILSVFYNDFRQDRGIASVEKAHYDLILKERNINQNYGSVEFFLIPEDLEVMQSRFGDEEVPSYAKNLITLYKGISQYTIAQGLDIRLIPYNEFDRIYDIRDKVLKILEEDYKI